MTVVDLAKYVDTHAVLTYDTVSGTVNVVGDLTVNGAEVGGSAFDHLTEDAENSRIVADWEIYGTSATFPSGLAVGDADVPGAAILGDTSGLDFWSDAFNDSYARLHIDPADGSLHWGDGSAAPDMAAWRIATGGIGIGDPAQVGVAVPNAVVIGADGSLTSQSEDGSTYTYLDPNGFAEIKAATTADTALDVRINGDAEPRLEIKADGSLHWGGAANDLRFGLGQGGYGLYFEDADDDGIVLAQVPVDEMSVSESYLTLYPDGSIYGRSLADYSSRWLNFQKVGDANARFRLDAADSAIRLGDGTNPPDTGIRRGDAEAIYIGDPDAGHLEVYGGATADGYLYLQNATGDLSAELITDPLPQLKLNGNGAGIRLTSPDGSQVRTLRLSNAGAIEVVV